MNERKTAHEKYGEDVTPTLKKLFPTDVEVACRAEDGDLHFSIAWGEGHAERNMQLWIAGNALDDYLIPDHSAEKAEKKLFGFVQSAIQKMEPITMPQKVTVLSEDVRVY